MKTFRRELIILFIFFLIISAVSIYFYVEMDKAGVKEVPIHWNIHNEPDNFASPLVAVLIAPLVMLALMFTTWGMSIKKYSDSEKKSARFIILLIAALFVFLNWVALKAGSGYSRGETFDISLLHIGLGLLFILIGNQLGKMRPSYWIGIRIPATLNNEEVWNRVHRKSGRLMVLSGIFIFGRVFFSQYTWSWIFYIPLFVSIILMIVVIPAIEKKKVEKIRGEKTKS